MVHLLDNVVVSYTALSIADFSVAVSTLDIPLNAGIITLALIVTSGKLPVDSYVSNRKSIICMYSGFVFICCLSSS